MGVRAGWRRFRRGPRWVRVLVVVPVLVVAFAGIGAGVHAVLPDDRSLGEAVVSAVLNGLMASAAAALVAHWAGGFEASTAASKAIRRKAIPADADREVLRTGLAGFRRMHARLLPWFSGLLVLITALVAVLGVLNRGTSGFWAAAGLTAALAIGYPVLVRSRLRRVDRLLAELDGPETPEGTA